MAKILKKCNKQSPLRCLNCKKENCDLRKITMILKKLGLLKMVEDKDYSIRR